MFDRVTEEEYQATNYPLPPKGRFILKTGLRLGYLTVDKLAGRNENGVLMYFVRCDCGNIIRKTTHCLKPSRLFMFERSSCGCMMNSDKDIDKQTAIAKSKSLFNIDVLESGKTARDKWKFYCPTHGIFSRRYDTFIRSRTGCISCSKKKSGGFKQKIPAYLYVMSIKEADKIVAYKYGITNKDVEIRRKAISRKTKYQINVEAFVEGTGEDVLQAEKLCRVICGKNFLSQENLPQGFSETCSPTSVTYLYQILEYFKENSP